MAAGNWMLGLWLKKGIYVGCVYGQWGMAHKSICWISMKIEGLINRIIVIILILVLEAVKIW